MVIEPNIINYDLKAGTFSIIAPPQNAEYRGCNQLFTNTTARSLFQIPQRQQVLTCIQQIRNRTLTIGLLDLKSEQFQPLFEPSDISEGVHRPWDRLVAGNDNQIYRQLSDPSQSVDMEISYSSIDHANGGVLKFDLFTLLQLKSRLEKVFNRTTLVAVDEIGNFYFQIWLHSEASGDSAIFKVSPQGKLLWRRTILDIGQSQTPTWVGFKQNKNIGGLPAKSW